MAILFFVIGVGIYNLLLHKTATNIEFMENGIKLILVDEKEVFLNWHEIKEVVLYPKAAKICLTKKGAIQLLRGFYDVKSMDETVEHRNVDISDFDKVKCRKSF